MQDKLVTVNEDNEMEIHWCGPSYSNEQDDTTSPELLTQVTRVEMRLLCYGLDRICQRFLSWVVYDSDQFSPRFGSDAEREQGLYLLCLVLGCPLRTPRQLETGVLDVHSSIVETVHWLEG
eukprot:1186176-Prorocentrum_minimum.AAC.2